MTTKPTFSTLGDIVIRGARQHNLKNIDVTIPRHRFVVITGVSGSGKSSLALDTLYAEGQRRYVESLSSYARQFLGQMEKPQVDQITGLSPAIAIEQKTVSRNPRSTVGTITEILDYLRVLYARLGTPHCPSCGRDVEPQTALQIAEKLADLPVGTRFQLLAPVVRQRKGTHAKLLKQAVKDGYVRARVNGDLVDLRDGVPELKKTLKHTIELVIDRLQISDEDGGEQWQRLIDSAETTLKAGDGILTILLPDEEITLSEQYACAHCDLSFPELTPALFSFNSPFGMCPECNGLGVQLQVSPDLIVTQPHLSLLDGASPYYGELGKKKNSWTLSQLTQIAAYYKADLTQPWQDLPEDFRNALLFGSDGVVIKISYGDEEEKGWSGQVNRDVKGVVYHINRLFRQTKSDWRRRKLAEFMTKQPCPLCKGERLCAEARFVVVGEKRLPELSQYSIDDLHRWIISLQGTSTGELATIADELLGEIEQRLRFLLNVGLHYLTLDRPAPTLSGGESQRIRLASQLGSGLVGVLYILDEPSIGLHARDHHALLQTLLQLRDMGNTVVVIEHDEETMLAADYLIDLGPLAGVLGGELIAAGTPSEVMAQADSSTGSYLSGSQAITRKTALRTVDLGTITIRQASLHNLKQVDVAIPLGRFVCVTGVSGSGKSSLISRTLYPALARKLHNAKVVPGPFDRLEGLEQVDKIINITQSPIGRTPRSNPATYVGLFDEIRKLFANTNLAKERGYKSGRFSFNNKGGRCDDCSGHGRKKVEMHFLADVWVTCKTCGGAQFNRQTLEVAYRERTIADVLNMDVREALEFFAHHKKIGRILQTLHDVGLDYVKLGQSALTLSGGEAQRVKLAKELSRPQTGRTIYLLDEPTTGLHFVDIQKLLDVLHELVDRGNTVVVIEHNLDVIVSADTIIDLGPEGGAGGGTVVGIGTPAEIANNPSSHTGKFLRQKLATQTTTVQK